MTILWAFVLLLGSAIIAGLAFYAGKLLWLLKQQNTRQQQEHQVQQEKVLEKKRYLQESIVLISRAMQEQQCELSEGALRLWVLLDHWPQENKPDASQSYPGLYQMYLVVKDMPTHQARKEQDKKLTRQQDKVRQQAEIDLRELIQADIVKLLQRFQQA
ncbi:hypothetical protein GCM10010919_02120 [Alishewanella longhuensis]|uniref:DUF2489 domain-containing protein n=1 Tax=Alishewanella longhuensis TaxID=1091037 RepID=A0ABQ3KT87_9ALTE|nr:DUF2489 domain-containing protein [Alishewanella longhuensis]GHG59500.1 hypothetical protein GCM10010919_02120 [Alishewanella longhuensis]